MTLLNHHHEKLEFMGNFRRFNTYIIDLSLLSFCNSETKISFGKILKILSLYSIP